MTPDELKAYRRKISTFRIPGAKPRPATAANNRKAIQDGLIRALEAWRKTPEGIAAQEKLDRKLSKAK